MKKILFLLVLSPALLFAQAIGFPIADKPDGGAIGSAATTVDKLSAFNLNQTTAGQTLTIPSLTNTSAGKVIYVSNTGSVALTLSPGGLLFTGKSIILRWDGTQWSACNGGADVCNISCDDISHMATSSYSFGQLNSYNKSGLFGDASETNLLYIPYVPSPNDYSRVQVASNRVIAQVQNYSGGNPYVKLESQTPTKDNYLIVDTAVIKFSCDSTIVSLNPPAHDSSYKVAPTIYVDEAIADALASIAPSSGVGYKSYVAIINQSGTSAPVATVLHNDLGGSVTFSRTFTGQYIGTATGLLTAGKTMFFDSERGPIYEVYTGTPGDTFRIMSRRVDTLAYEDNLLIAYCLEIRVYP